MKKLIALVLALAMMLTCVAAFASETETETNQRDHTYTNWDDTTNSGWNGVPDGSIGLSGLKPGDKVKFYRVLEYNQDATGVTRVYEEDGETYTEFPGAGSWKVTEKFESAVTEADLRTILSTGIDAELAGKIGKNATGETSITATADEDGNAVYSKPGAGLYVAIITPAVAGMMYNPVFVASDYYTTTDGDQSSTWKVTDALSYSNGAMAKMTTIDVKKTAKDKQSNDDNYSETVRVGDTVDFTVETTIPEFADNYTSAVFKVTDVLSDGLKLDTTSIKVYYGHGDAKQADVIPNVGTDYSITPTTTGEGDSAKVTGYVINFTTEYLLGLEEAKAITVEYSAEVTNEALTSVNIDDNTVTVNFSNHPEDSTGKGTLKDETKHYTFDIDGNLLGGDTWKTIEVVKIGVDKNGNEITKETIREGQEYGALKGAEFELRLADKTTRYVNEYYPATAKIVSDDEGRLTVEGASVPGIRGLDAGVYYLVETKAPDGYIRAQEPVKIEITTKMKTVNYEDEIEGIKVKWDVQELDEYTIKIADQVTATYTMTNEKPNKGDTIIGSVGHDEEGKIKNTQGVELPSTGGIGTTIFYVLGGLLVVGAAIILVARRKAHD